MLKNLPELPGSIGSLAHKLAPFGGYPYPQCKPKRSPIFFKL